MSKRRRRKASRVSSGSDRHHILFYRKEWSKTHALKLRRCFVYELPKAVHQELHSAVDAVPVLSESEARELWILFQKVDEELSLFDALEWLIENAPSAEFGSAIQSQLDFLQNHLERF